MRDWEHLSDDDPDPQSYTWLPADASVDGDPDKRAPEAGEQSSGGAGAPPDGSESQTGDDDEDTPSGDSLNVVLVRLALEDGAELFHDSSGVGYARVTLAGRREVWPIRSERTAGWLHHLLWSSARRVATPEAARQAIASLEAMARFDREQHPVHLRSAWTPNGGIAYDLGASDGDAVVVEEGGWILGEPDDVRFLHRDGTLPLRAPQRGGSVELLRNYLNLDSDEDLMLVVGWLVMAIRPDGPFAILILQGEQGSGKSTGVRVLKRLVDPVKAPIRAVSHNERDLMIAAESNRVIAFDNVSTLRPAISDAICRLATGGGFATRALYTNDEERVFEHTRPMVINGIEAIATRQDLLDRSIVLWLPSLQDRDDETDLWERFEREAPLILGSLMSGASRALRDWEATPVPKTRMADFARWAAAAMPEFGWSPEEFLEAYAENRSNALKASLEGSVLSRLIGQLLGSDSMIVDTATSIHGKLAAMLEPNERTATGFPRTAQAMSKQLTMLAPALREVGIDVVRRHEGSGDAKVRMLVIRRVS